MDQQKNRSYGLLVVDDSDDDRFFLRKAVQRNSRLTIVAEVCNGEDAIAYLRGENVFADREKFPVPDALLLDLKMPRKNGYEVLEWLQTQSFGNLTVIVLSGSVLPEDVAKTLDLGAHDYKIKTTEEKQQILLVQEIESLLDRRHKHIS